jgi:hypothetical protein
MYRFLDKRFYPRHQPPAVEMDLQDFACGHIGLTQVANVAELKRRLAPAIAELEEIGFIERADPAARYSKVRVGVWRIHFQAGPQFDQSTDANANRSEPETLMRPRPTRTIPATEEINLVKVFYEAWNGVASALIGEKDLQQARDILQTHGASKAMALVPLLVQIVKRKWPECKSFSGAVAQYLSDALQHFGQRQQRLERKEQDRLLQQQQRAEIAHSLQEQRELVARWQALPEPERKAIEEAVLQQYPAHQGRPAIFRGLCLDFLAKREQARRCEQVV